MTTFTYFDEPKLSPVDISLYQNADTAGIAAGNAQSSTTSAILQGITSGIKTGADLYKTYQGIKTTEQEQQIRQNQIEQLPTTNAIQAENLKQEKAQTALEQNRVSQLDTTNALQEEQLKANQTSNQINALRLQHDQNLQTISIEADKAKAEQEVAQSNQVVDAINTRNSIYQSLSSGNKDQALATLSDPKAQAYLHSHPEEYTSIAGALYKNQFIDANGYQQLLNEANHYKEVDAETRRMAVTNKAKAAVTADADKAAKEVYKDAELAPFVQAAGANDVSQLPLKYEMLEDGSYTADPKTNIINRDIPIQFKSLGGAATYSMIDAETGKVLKTGISKTAAGRYDAAAVAYTPLNSKLASVMASRATRGVPLAKSDVPVASETQAPTLEDVTKTATAKGVPGELLQSIQAEARTRGANAGVFERMSSILPSFLQTNQVDNTITSQPSSTESPFTTQTRNSIDATATDLANQTIDKLQNGSEEEKTQVRALLSSNDLKATIPALKEYYSTQIRGAASDVYNANWEAGAQANAAANQSRAGLLAQESKLQSQLKGKSLNEVLASTNAIRTPTKPLTGETSVTPQEAETKARDIGLQSNMSKAQIASFSKTASRVVAHPLLSDQPDYVQAVASIEFLV